MRACECTTVQYCVYDRMSVCVCVPVCVGIRVSARVHLQMRKRAVYVRATVTVCKEVLESVWDRAWWVLASVHECEFVRVWTRKNACVWGCECVHACMHMRECVCAIVRAYTNVYGCLLMRVLPYIVRVYVHASSKNCRV